MPPLGAPLLLLQSDPDRYWAHGLFVRDYDQCTCRWGEYNDTEVRLQPPL
jgi:hypothetical protein